LAPGEHTFSRYLRLLGSVEVWTDHVKIVKSVCNLASQMLVKYRKYVMVFCCCFLKEKGGEGCFKNGDFDTEVARAKLEYLEARQDFGAKYEHLHYILAEVRSVRTQFFVTYALALNCERISTHCFCFNCIFYVMKAKEKLTEYRMRERSTISLL